MPDDPKAPKKEESAAIPGTDSALPTAGQLRSAGYVVDDKFADEDPCTSYKTDTRVSGSVVPVELPETTDAELTPEEIFAVKYADNKDAKAVPTSPENKSVRQSGTQKGK